jgi:hypothetical protein
MTASTHFVQEEHIRTGLSRDRYGLTQKLAQSSGHVLKVSQVFGIVVRIGEGAIRHDI